MVTRRSLWSLLVVALPIWAASARGADFDKYLLDDTDFVITVNLKQILANPQAKKEIANLLAKASKADPEAWKIFTEFGIDPIKDVDRLTIVAGRSSHQSEGKPMPKQDSSEGPLVVVEGRFDSGKWKAKAAQPAGNGKGAVTIQEFDGGKYYRLTFGSEGPYFAIVEPNTLIFTTSKEYLVDAFAKAGGKKKTAFKHKAMADLLDRIDLKQSVAGGAIGEMISGSEHRFTNGQSSVTHHTLAEQGIQSALGSIKIGDKIAGSLVLKMKDLATAQRITATMQQGIDEGIKESAKEIEKHKEMAPLLEVMKSIRIVAKDNGITLTGEGGLDALGASAFGWLGFATVRTEPVAVPGPGK